MALGGLGGAFRVEFMNQLIHWGDFSLDHDGEQLSAPPSRAIKH